MAEEIVFQGREYRSQGGEVHQRPADRSWRTPWDAAWLVLDPEEVPQTVREHFKQAQNRAAVN